VLRKQSSADVDGVFRELKGGEKGLWSRPGNDALGDARIDGHAGGEREILCLGYCVLLGVSTWARRPQEKVQAQKERRKDGLHQISSGFRSD